MRGDRPVNRWRFGCALIGLALWAGVGTGVSAAVILHPEHSPIFGVAVSAGVTNGPDDLNSIREFSSFPFSGSLSAASSSDRGSASASGALSASVETDAATGVLTRYRAQASGEGTATSTATGSAVGRGGGDMGFTFQVLDVPTVVHLTGLAEASGYSGAQARLRPRSSSTPVLDFRFRSPPQPPDDPDTPPQSPLLDEILELSPGEYVLNMGAGATASNGSSSASFDLQATFSDVLPPDPSGFRWINPGAGAWNDGDNWDQGAAPGFADDAVVGAAGNYAIGLESDVDLTSLLISPIDDDELRVTLGPAAAAGPIAVHLGTLQVGGQDRTLAASEASLTLSDLGVTVFEEVTLGGTTVGTAKLVVDPGTTAVFESALRVGDQLTAGVLEVVATGGTAATLDSGALTVGGNELAPGQTSEVLVRGADASYSISGQVAIGEAANSYFEVAEGGTVSVGDALSVKLDHDGRLYVHGEGSSFSYRDGEGELRIEDGVAEFDDMATGAFFAARVGGGDSSPEGEPGLSVRNGAELELTGDLKVGLLGSGFVAIEQEGRLRAGDVNIGPPDAVNNEQTATVLVREDGVLESLDFIVIGSVREEGGELFTSPGHLGVESGGQVNVLGTGGIQLDYGSLDVDGVTSEVGSLTGSLRIGNARAAFTGGAFGSFESVAVQAPLGGGDNAELVIANSTVQAGNPLGTDVTVGGEAGGVIAMVNGLLDTEGGEVFIDHNGMIAGTGTVRGTVTGSGFLSPGLSPGTLIIDGDWMQEPGGVLQIEFAGLGAGEFDVLHVTGDAFLQGTLELLFRDGFLPEAGDVLGFLQVDGALSGGFSDILFPNLQPGFRVSGLEFIGDAYSLTVLTDARSITQSVPAPASTGLVLLGFGTLLGAMRPRRRRTPSKRASPHFPRRDDNSGLRVAEPCS